MFERKHPYGTMLTIAIVGGIVFWFAGGSRIKDIAPYYIKKVVNETAQVKINDMVLDVEIAKTSKSKEKGLSGREYIAPDKGILFVFNESGFYPFWTRGMKLSIDIIYIENDRVVEVVKQTPVPVDNSFVTYTTSRAFNFVVETRSGYADRYGIDAGDMVEITLDD